jgi:hypothetical protein
MTALPDVLTEASKKDAVILDCVELIDAEVRDKSGISALVIKAAYSTVKGIKPGFIQEVVAHLLPDFAQALDPLYQDAKTQGRPVADFFGSNTSKVADALLSITDARAARAKNPMVKGTYEKLRGQAKKNVESAVPRLGKMIEKYDR